MIAPYLDNEFFQVHDHYLSELNETVRLIQPTHIGIKWNQKNKVFRSSVWNLKGELVSAGLPKFTNWGENPDQFPPPISLDNCNVVEKMDGSALIVSKYKGVVILRTRGTVDASKLDNGYEIDTFKRDILSKLVAAESNHDDSWPISYVFEWITASPKHRIVINYNNDEPQFILVAIINHSDYSLWKQHTLNQFAATVGLKRPENYTFTCISSLLYDIEKWKGKEGVCVYSNDGQSIHKVKSGEYLSKHRFKENATLEATVDLFFSLGLYNYNEFQKKLIEIFDYECFEMVRGFVSTICDAWKAVEIIVNGMKQFVEKISVLPTRKDQALQITSSYGKTNRAAFVFTLLDKKQLNTEQYKKLLYQVLKK
jgi:hypothetical protein